MVQWVIETLTNGGFNGTIMLFYMVIHLYKWRFYRMGKSSYTWLFTYHMIFLYEKCGTKSAIVGGIIIHLPAILLSTNVYWSWLTGWNQKEAFSTGIPPRIWGKTWDISMEVEAVNRDIYIYVYITYIYICIYIWDILFRKWEMKQ